jgi:leader peptidase (prepilin peptidase)/N-methyltransferase
MAAYGGEWFNALPLSLLAFILLTVSLVDWEVQEIPDGLLIFGAAVAVFWVGLKAGSDFAYARYAWPIMAPTIPDALIGALVGGLFLFAIDRLVWLLIKKDGFGMGDVKLMAMAGLFLGWQMTLVAYFFAILAGGCYAAFLLATGRAKRGAYLPFGPFLSAGVLTALWFGQGFMDRWTAYFYF